VTESSVALPSAFYGASYADTIPALADQLHPDETATISKAFDDAWARLQRDQADPAMSSLVRTALAKRIIEMASRPEMTATKRLSKTIRSGPLHSRPVELASEQYQWTCRAASIAKSFSVAISHVGDALSAN
jgi:hypothetical protein